MRLSSLLVAGVSFLGFAAALPEAYPDVADSDVVGRLGKRSWINNLETRQSCGGLDTRTQSYTIASGDTLSKIGDDFHRGYCDIAKANNISYVDYIQAGAKITIPPQVCSPDTSSCVLPKPTATCVNGGPGFYIVQSGDALGLIAYMFNVTLDAIEGANKANIPNPDLVQVGQIVNVPICADSTCEISPYKIKKGDTFFHLSRKYHSTEGSIRSVNPGVNPNNLQIDQVVTLASYCHKFPGSEPDGEL